MPQPCSRLSRPINCSSASFWLLRLRVNWLRCMTVHARGTARPQTVAAAIIIERLWTLQKGRVLPKDLTASLVAESDRLTLEMMVTPGDDMPPEVLGDSDLAMSFPADTQVYLETRELGATIESGLNSVAQVLAELGFELQRLHDGDRTLLVVRVDAEGDPLINRWVTIAIAFVLTARVCRRHRKR